MKQSIILLQNPKRSTSLSKKLSSNVDKPSYNLSKTLLVWGIVLAFTLPVWRSGLKSNLTLWQFIVNHTVFGDEPEFIPKEDYEKIFSGEE